MLGEAVDVTVEVGVTVAVGADPVGRLAPTTGSDSSALTLLGAGLGACVGVCGGPAAAPRRPGRQGRGCPCGFPHTR
jgi:hypothetical protein